MSCVIWCLWVVDVTFYMLWFPLKLCVHVLHVMFIRLCFTCQDVGGLVGTPRFLCVSFSRPTFGVSLPWGLVRCVVFRVSHAWRDASFSMRCHFERCFTNLSLELISSPVRLEVKKLSEGVLIFWTMLWTCWCVRRNPIWAELIGMYLRIVYTRWRRRNPLWASLFIWLPRACQCLVLHCTCLCGTLSFGTR